MVENCHHNHFSEYKRYVGVAYLQKIIQKTTQMEKEIKSSILLSIFKRKGGEGTFTKIIDAGNSSVYKKELDHLLADEEGVIICKKDDQNWFLLTNQRVLQASNGILNFILNNDLKTVRPSLEEEQKNILIDKRGLTMLTLEDSTGKKNIINLEEGAPYNGIYQVLHFISG